MREIQNNLVAIQQRIDKACDSCGRPRGSVKLLAVSKTKPISMIKAAYEAGQTDFGENYLQDALPKIHDLQGAAWHFIGHIQSNKARDIAENFDWVHTVSTMKVLTRLDRLRPKTLPNLKIMLQVNISEESSKSGTDESELFPLVEKALELKKLDLRGLMAIPEATDNEQQQRLNFAKLASLQQRIQSDYQLDDFTELSMGMSNDLESAIAEGATWVRVGTAIFGARQ